MPSIKLIAVVTGLVLGLWQGADYAAASQTQKALYLSAPALSPSAPVTPAVLAAPTPAPTPASSLVFVTIRGIACIDRDNSGVCSADEARVPNVIIRNSDGVAVISDSSGEFTIQAAPRSELDIAIPAGYKSINGNRYRIQMADPRNIDIALSIDTYYHNSSGSQDRSLGGANSEAAQTTADNLPFPVNNTILRLGLIITVILAALAVLIIFCIIQRVYLRSISRQDVAQRDQQSKDIANQLEVAGGWQLVAGQVVADILHKPVSIDEGAGILNAVAEPSPRFSIVTLDRHEIMFTTSPGFVRKARLIRGGDRIIDITARSAVNHTSIRMLWQHICATRGMLQVMPPETAHWHMAVRFADNRPERKRQYNKANRMVIPTAKSRPYKPWRGQA